jgi:hypothetical protein
MIYWKVFGAQMAGKSMETADPKSVCRKQVTVWGKLISLSPTGINTKPYASLRLNWSPRFNFSTNSQAVNLQVKRYDIQEKRWNGSKIRTNIRYKGKMMVTKIRC